MIEEEGDGCEHRQEGAGEADVDIRRFVHPHVPGPVPDGDDWPGKEYGLSPTEYENFLARLTSCAGFAGKLQDSKIRDRIMFDVSNQMILPDVFAGYLLALGYSMDHVANLYIREAHKGSELRRAVEEHVQRYQEMVDKGLQGGGASATAVGAARTASLQKPLGFFKNKNDDEDIFEVDNSGTSTKVDLTGVAHVAQALPASHEERQSVRSRDLDQEKTKELLDFYYAEKNPQLRFNAETLTHLNSKAGDKLLTGAVVPLPKMVAPKAIDEEVKHDLLLGQRNTTLAEKAKDAQMRETQKLVRNAIFRFIAPLHAKTATAAVACETDEVILVALSGMMLEDETVNEAIERLPKQELTEALVNVMGASLRELADDCALLLHAFCTKDITLQKQSLMLNEGGSREQVHKMYGDVTKSIQTAVISAEEKKKLDETAQQSRLLTSLVFQQMNGKGYKRKEHEHRTPSSNRRSGAPKKNFESSRQTFRQPDFQYQNQRDEKTQSTPATGRGRGGGRGGSRGRGSPSPRGRGQPFRGGSPPRR